MASDPKRTEYAIPASASPQVFKQIPCTIFACKTMEIIEVPGVTAGSPSVQVAYAAQGLQYQVWDPSLNGGIGGFGPTLQAYPGEPIQLGDGFSVIGNNAQPANWAGTRAADVPIQIVSATAVATRVQVREPGRKITTALV
jgi:hypothetical protein